MSNLSLSRSQNPQSAIIEPTCLQVDHESADAPLAAPKPFFGRHLTFQTAIDCHHSSLRILQERQRLLLRSSLGLPHQTNLPQQIRALEGRASAYAILAKEAEAELLSELGENVIQPESGVELNNVQANAVSSNESHPQSVATLLPPQLPAPFFASETTTNFSNIQRKQRQQLKIAEAHQDKAKQYLREVRNAMKRLVLVKEHGNLPKAKILEQSIEQLKNRANYHTVIARETEMQAYGHDSQSPGANNTILQGNYELEFPVRPPSDTYRAEEIKNPREDLIRLPKTKAIPLASAQFLESKKLSAKEKQQLPIAKKVPAKEVTAGSPKNLKLPEAKARLIG